MASSSHNIVASPVNSPVHSEHSENPFIEGADDRHHSNDESGEEASYAPSTTLQDFFAHNYYENPLPIKCNNQYLVPSLKSFGEANSILLHILENHFLFPLLSKTVKLLPVRYVNQFWQSCFYDRASDIIRGYTSTPDHSQTLDMKFNRTMLSLEFELPTRGQMGIKNYAPLPNDEEIIDFLHMLGYNQPLVKRNDFRRARLPPLWNVLFSILNRYLTCKTGSPDQSSSQILAIMYGIYYDLPLDYAYLIMMEIIGTIDRKNTTITSKLSNIRGS